MKAPVSISWVNNLYEVGTPIRRTAADIETRALEAAQRLERAKKAYREEILQIQKDKLALRKQVDALWTAAEIDSAKRGFCLVDGKEIKL